MTELAQQLIEREKRERTGYLDLGNCGLTELPDLSELDWLETLIVSNNWWDKGKRQWMSSQNASKPNRITLPPSRDLPVSLKKVIFGGDNRIKWAISDWSFLEKLTNLTTLSLRSNQIRDGSFLESLTNLTMISFGLNQIRHGSFLEKLTNLTSLDLGDNNISDGTFLGNMVNLISLDLSGNQISDGTFLENLTNLTMIDLSGNQIIYGFFLEKLTNLTTLGLGGNQISDGTFLEKLTNLTTLDLGYNEISDGFFLEKLTNLTTLDLSYNQISDGFFLEKLTNLATLDLCYNQISDISFLGSMTNLTSLNLSNNQFENLTPVLPLMIKHLMVVWKERASAASGEINVWNNPLTNPPREIVEKGNEAILRHWAQIAKQKGAETINEAKLIIVGEGKTGKTTLFNKLINPDYDLEKNPTDETHGINVHEGFEITPGFQANLWDFGGQDLQYMTHQFFLTPRALYVLVMEARSESPNLPYWFRIISLLGESNSFEKVSLLLVLNKRKDSTGRPQFEDLLKIYVDDFDLEFLEVDFSTNDKRWECLHEAIVRRLSDLPIVKNLLPKRWKTIREALRKEGESRPYIGAERLHEICSEYGVTDEEDQWQMTDYLHQLGSVLHFQNDPDLLDTVILRAKWAVDGVYTILKSELIKNRNGKFTQEDIFHILRGNGYKNIEAQKILKLMSKHNFDICYLSKSGNHYVAAQLLQADRPALFAWHKHAGALQFRYQYSIMPKGLMSRLIVRLSDYIEVLDGVEIVWKKGAILQIPVNNSVCRVMMFEDEDSKSGLKQIVIEVLEDHDRRQNRKYALQQVREEVEDLHRRWFRNIQFEQIIPCNCERCKSSTEPYAFQLSDLQRLTKGKAFCNVLEDFVPVLQLLEGVYERKEIQEIAQKERNHLLHAEGMGLHINIENKPQITVTNQNINVGASDLAALEKMLDQLAPEKKEALKNYVEMLPEPETPEEKTSLGRSIAKWLDKNAEGMAVNVSASVYYDALKALFGF